MGVVRVEGFVNIQPGEEGVGVVRVEGFVNIHYSQARRGWGLYGEGFVNIQPGEEGWGLYG